LYGQTTDILAARAAGVIVALAPDWATTGSSNLLDELRFAYAYSLKRLGGALEPQDLFKMITSDAALVAGQKNLGQIKEGNAADLVLIPKLDVSEKATAYSNLLHAYPNDIRAVFVAGEPVYGDVDFMKRFRKNYDVLSIGAGQKAIFITEADGKVIHAADLQARLSAQLPQLAPIFEP
jgi:5-methylthioadenosine/S-adenosylhomocysteine deaminase